METSKKTISTTWGKIISDSTDFTFQNRCPFKIFYVYGTEAPEDNISAHVLLPGESVASSIQGQGEIWAACENDNGYIVITA